METNSMLICTHLKGLAAEVSFTWVERSRTQVLTAARLKGNFAR